MGSNYIRPPKALTSASLVSLIALKKRVVFAAAATCSGVTACLGTKQRPVRRMRETGLTFGHAYRSNTRIAMAASNRFMMPP